MTTEFEQMKEKLERAEKVEAAFRNFVDECVLVNNHHNHVLLVKAYTLLGTSSLLGVSNKSTNGS